MFLRGHALARKDFQDFGAARTAWGPPALVQPKIRERTRWGYCSANSWAIMPPIETPKGARSGTRGIENRGGIGSHQRDGIDARWNIALADAAIIKSDGAKTLRQKWAGAMPHVGGIAEAYDEQRGSPEPCSSQ